MRVNSPGAAPPSTFPARPSTAWMSKRCARRERKRSRGRARATARRSWRCAPSAIAAIRWPIPPNIAARTIRAPWRAPDPVERQRERILRRRAGRRGVPEAGRRGSSRACRGRRGIRGAEPGARRGGTFFRGVDVTAGRREGAGMATQVLMPALSPEMKFGKLTRWLKREGEFVEAGDILAEIETEKATMEVEAAESGVIERILVPEGAEKVAVNEPIAVIAAAEKAAAAPARNRNGAPWRKWISRPCASACATPCARRWPRKCGATRWFSCWARRSANPRARPGSRRAWRRNSAQTGWWTRRSANTPSPGSASARPLPA